MKKGNIIKRIIVKLKTIRLYFIIYSIFKRNKDEFYKRNKDEFYENLLRDWNKDDVYGPWTKYKKNDGKFYFYKSYYLITTSDEKPDIESLKEKE